LGITQSLLGKSYSVSDVRTTDDEYEYDDEDDRAL